MFQDRQSMSSSCSPKASSSTFGTLIGVLQGGYIPFRHMFCCRFFCPSDNSNPKKNRYQAFCWGNPTGFILHQFNPIGSMYDLFTYICHNSQPNVGKYTIHGSYGNEKIQNPVWECYPWKSMESTVFFFPTR